MMSWRQVRPFLGVVCLQFAFAGMATIGKFALNQGLNHYSFVVYRHAIATIVIAPFALLLERKVRPKINTSIFTKIMLLGLVQPVIDQNLYYAGMKYTTATFVAALCNIVPALTFVLAWIFRLEKVNVKRLNSLAKVAGTMLTVGGATLMTLFKGPVLKLPWTERAQNHGPTWALNPQDPIKGALMVSAACLCGASFVILQAITLKSYPAEMSLTALICLAGTIEGGIVALVMEWGNDVIWSIHFDSKLLACLYGGILCSGIAYYVQGMVMKEKGPVFITAFSPLSMIIVAFMGSFILSEQLSLGRMIGAVVIVAGLYLVIWGKIKDDHESSHTNIEQILPIESPQTNKNTSTDAPINHHLSVNDEITDNESV